MCIIIITVQSFQYSNLLSPTGLSDTKLEKSLRCCVERFKKIEEAALLSVKFNQTILATGGSAIFSKDAMSYIKNNSSVVYLEVSFEDIVDRIPDFSNRGFIKEANQTMQQAFNERESIYREFADHIVPNHEGIESCFNKILSII